MAGIATPQGVRGRGSQGASLGQKARGYLEELILNKIVSVRAYGTDMEDRVVAELYLDGRNINLEMIRAGFAEVYSERLHKYLDLEPYRRAEEEARKAGRGMWALVGR